MAISISIVSVLQIVIVTSQADTRCTVRSVALPCPHSHKAHSLVNRIIIQHLAALVSTYVEEITGVVRPLQKNGDSPWLTRAAASQEQRYVHVLMPQVERTLSLYLDREIQIRVKEDIWDRLMALLHLFLHLTSAVLSIHRFGIVQAELKPGTGSITVSGAKPLLTDSCRHANSFVIQKRADAGPQCAVREMRAREIEGHV